MKTVLEVYGLNKVKLYNNSKVTPLDCPAPQLAFGLELELENTGMDSWHIGGMTGGRDESLRNNGWEYKTLPSTFSVVMSTLERFFNSWKITQEENYSERTSTHVHINVQDLQFTQVASLVAIYQVFEKLLFNFVGADRDKNIFCVPLSECVLAYRAPVFIADDNLDNVSYIINRWQKYAALNLLTIPQFGTIEFRHMPGTCNLELIGNWLKIISAMYNFAVVHPYDDVINQLKTLNTTSEYRNILHRVFDKYADLLMYPAYELDIEDGVLNLKYSIMSPSKKNKAYKHNLLDAAVINQTPEIGRLIRESRAIAQGEATANPNFNYLAHNNWIIHDDLIPEAATTVNMNPFPNPRNT